jgi:lysophospholipase L1-like esterase
VTPPLIIGAAVVVAVALLVGIATASSRDGGHRTRVYLFGDSLVLQASHYWRDQMQADGFDASQSSYAGTNTCDWFAKMRTIESTWHPDVVVLSFGGNDLTKCMRHADGSRLSTAEFRAKFRRDTEHALSLFPAVHAFYLIAPPAMYDGDDRFGSMYRKVAASRPDVHYVDGGSVVTPDRQWLRTLPCLPAETDAQTARGAPAATTTIDHLACSGPVVNGVRENVVRAPDRVHFCPVAIPFGARCPVYSPGAYRYATTIADAIRDGER